MPGWVSTSVSLTLQVSDFLSGLNRLIVTPGFESTASIETHFEPKVSIGINAFDGVASASVFLSADASATASFNLAANNAFNSFSGCVDVKAGLGVNVGADASFFGLFDDSTSYNLYTGGWDVYNVGFLSPTHYLLGDIFAHDHNQNS